MGLFYDLKSNDTLSPLRERPFQQKDWTWLKEAEQQKVDDGLELITLDLGLSGMSCMACVWLVETAAKQHEGVIETRANNANGSFELSYQANQTDISELADALFKLGYEVLPKKLGKHQGVTESLVVRLGICGALAMNTMAFTLPRYNGMETSEDLSSLLTTISVASSTLALLIGGSYFFKRAWTALRLGGIHMDLPISLGLIISYIGSIVGWAADHENLFYFDFVAIFTFLMLTGKQVQITSLNRANRRFQADTTIPEFYTSREGLQIDTEDIDEDSVLQIPPGTVVPLEASLLSDKADISLAWLTGEPSSQCFQHGAILPAGAVNQSSNTIEIQTNEASSKDSAINTLLSSKSRQVDQTDNQPQQRAIQIYLGIILLAGLLASAAWWYFTQDWVKALQVLISIYVVSCPCGIGLALPLLDTRSSEFAHHFGIFPLTTRFWENLNRVHKVVFDKTGTLTLDKPELVDLEQLHALPHCHQEALFTLTKRSHHPLSRSIFSALIKAGITNTSIPEGADETAGMGTSLKLANGDHYFLGRGHHSSHTEELHCQLRLNEAVICDFHFHEAARQSAATAVTAIKKLLPNAPSILSGDSPERVERLANKLGIAEHHGGLMPQEKELAIQKLEEHPSPVLYIGDGVNDLPALQRATLSGAPFANINMLTSDVDFLFTDESMGFLAKLFDIKSQRRRRKLTLVAYTIIYNLMVLGIACSGHMSPLLAAILMPLSSLLSLAIVTRRYH